MELRDILLPAVMEILSQVIILLVVPAIVAWVGMIFARLTGERLTAARRARLHDVLASGVSAAMARGLTDRADISRSAIAYAKRNAPGIIKATKATDMALAEIADAKTAG
jgi:hypothetical protein